MTEHDQEQEARHDVKTITIMVHDDNADTVFNGLSELVQDEDITSMTMDDPDDATPEGNTKIRDIDPPMRDAVATIREVVAYMPSMGGFRGRLRSCAERLARHHCHDSVAAIDPESYALTEEQELNVDTALRFASARSHGQTEENLVWLLDMGRDLVVSTLATEVRRLRELRKVEQTRAG